MKICIRSQSIKPLLVTWIVAAASLLPQAASFGATPYTLSLLAPQLGPHSYASGINKQGEVVGYWMGPEGARAFLIREGVLTDLGPLGSQASYALSINDTGDVAGFGQFDGQTRAFVYRGGRVGALHDGESSSYAYGINAAGEVVGYIATETGARAVLYQHGRTTTLGTLGGTNSYAFGINALTQIAGSSLTPDNLGHAAFIWDEGTLINLNDLLPSPSGWVLEEARGINDAGTIVGWGLLNGQLRAFRFHDGQAISLGTLQGEDSFALGINAPGQIVGSSSVPEEAGRHAFLWVNGQMMDLNGLVPGLNGWTLREARGINDHGQIVGWGVKDGREQAFLLTPLAEPALAANGGPAPAQGQAAELHGSPLAGAHLASAASLVPGSALLVVGSTTLTGLDLAVSNRLQNIVSTVVVRNSSVAAAEAAGKLLVVISRSVADATVLNKFASNNVPMMTWEEAIYATNGLAPAGSANFGTEGSQTSVAILTPWNVLATNLAGTVGVSTSSTFSWGRPGTNAVRIAGVAGDPSKVLIFGYEKGAVMPGLTAPARRAGFLFGSALTNALNANAWNLFDAAVRWLLAANVPPTAKWTVPPDGTVVTAGTNLTLLATALDIDSGVRQVKFYRQSVPIGVGTNATGTNYGMVWTNAPAGTHPLVAVAVDQGGLSATSAPATVVIRTNVLFVTASTALNAGETQISNRLAAQGFVLVPKAASGISSNDAFGRTLVLISASASAASVANHFTLTGVPVVNWNRDLFDDLGLTFTNSTNFGTTNGQRFLAIQSPGHPMAANLAGVQEVMAGLTNFNWARPGSNAVVIAGLTNDAAKALIFGFEKGALLAGFGTTTNPLAAPARRVGFFLTSSNAVLLTPAGWSLFDAAVAWALAKPCPPHVDLMLTLDVSQSLTDEDFEASKQAASNFVNFLNFTLDRAGLVSFAGTARTDVPLTNNAALLQSAIVSLAMRSGTFIDAPIHTSQWSLATSPVGFERILLLQTDGVLNDTDGQTALVKSNNAVAAATLAKNAGTRIICIGYGTDNNGQSLLRVLASSPADYYYSPAVAALPDIFATIADSVCRLDKPPVVNITHPAPDTVFLAPASVRIDAEAMDVDGSVVSVEFFAGTTSLGLDLTPPFSVTWNNPPPGVHELTARAQDNQNLRGTSAIVRIIVNAPLSIEIIKPAARQITSWGFDTYGQVRGTDGQTDVRSAVAGISQSAAVMNDGTVRAWGYNASGATNVPAGLSGVVQVAVGLHFMVALKSDGTVRTWGAGAAGNNPPPGLSSVKAVAAGGSHALALLSNGTVLAWGTSSSSQTNVPMDLTGVTAISAGNGYSLALKSDGAVVKWGTALSVFPSNLTGVSGIAAGYSHAVVHRSDGSLQTWGANGFPGNGIPAGENHGFMAVASGYFLTVGLRTNGVVVAWGSGYNGTTNVPAHLTNVLAISAGRHVLALRTDFHYCSPPASLPVQARVTDPAGRLAFVVIYGGGTFLGTTVADPHQVVWNQPPAGHHLLEASAFDHLGEEFQASPVPIAINAAPSVTLTSPANGAFYPASPTNLVLSASPSDPEGRIVRVEFLSGATIVGVATAAPWTVTWSNVTYGAYNITARVIDSCGLSAVSPPAAITINSPPAVAIVVPPARGVIAWGVNNQAPPSGLPDALVNVTRVSAGLNHSVAQLQNGTVLAWGDDSFGQLGVPAAATNVTTISAAGHATLALRADGTVVGWGFSMYDGDPIYVPAAAASSVRAIAAGRNHYLVAKADGTVTGWGLDNHSQVTGAEDAYDTMAVAAGGYHSLSLVEDGGIVLGWGRNDFGQATVPPGLPTVRAIAAGDLHSMALLWDGTVRVWGDNSRGQTNIPTGLGGVVAIAAGAWHCLALKSDGTVVQWGDTEDGGIITPPPGLGGVMGIAAGEVHDLAITTNGTLFVAAPTNIYIRAVASDAGGSVAKVEFYRDGSLLGEDLTDYYGNFEFTWASVGPGNYVLTAAATDNVGARTVSAPVRIVVNAPPTVAITAPANQQVFLVGAPIAINATSSDPDGVVVRVEFFAGLTRLGEDTASPYNVVWSGAPVGSHALTAVATDNRGMRVKSEPVVVHVRQGPSVSIVTPTNGQAFDAPATITLTALAEDVDGVVTSVSYFVNGNPAPLASSSFSPYRFTWNNVLGSTNIFTAVATDNHGYTASSLSVTVTVRRLPPSVRIVSPLPNTTNAFGQPIPIVAEASDVDGVVTKVEFFNGATKLGEDLSAPFTFTWVGAPLGSANLQARATDNDALVGNSAVVPIFIEGCPTPASLADFTLSSSSVAGGTPVMAMVTLDGNAIAGGQAVALSSSHPEVVVPGSVLVSEGTDRVEFEVVTRSVAEELTVQLSAAYHQGSPIVQPLVLLPGLGGRATGGTSQTEVVTIKLGNPGVMTPEDLVREIVGPEVVFSSVQFVGTSYSAGLFSGGTAAFGLESGLILSSGDITNAAGSNTSPGASAALDLPGDPGDPDLARLVPESTIRDPTTLSFEFLPSGDFVTWDYVFASEEYNEYVGQFNDVFGFFLNGTNVALLPDMLTVVSVNNVNNDANSEFYVDNSHGGPGGNPDSPFPTQMDGRTIVLQVRARVIPGVLNRVKLAVADANDMALDSVVMIRARSFRTGGHVIRTRDDFNRTNYPAMTLTSADRTVVNAVPGSFDFRSVEGTVTSARMERAGSVSFDRGSHFDLQWAVQNGPGGAISFGPVLSEMHLLASPRDYGVDWFIDPALYPGIEQSLGGIYQPLLLDQISSLCGHSHRVSDTPHAGWPTNRNILTVQVLGKRQVAQGRCQDLALDLNNAPLNGDWDILLDGQIQGSSGRPNGWSVEPDCTVYGGFHVCAPAGALIASAYEARIRTVQSARSGSFSVVPAGTLNSAPVLLPLALSTNKLTGPSLVLLTVALDSLAPGGGAYVTLRTSGLPNPGLPAYVVIPPGARSITTNFNQSAATPGELEITASYNGYRKARLRVTTCPGAAPAMPMNLQALANQGVAALAYEGTMLLTWDEDPARPTYRIQRRNTDGGTFETIFTGLTTNRFVDTGLAPAQEYEYRVFAVNDCFESDPASVTQSLPIATVAPTPILVPDGGRFHDSVVVLLTNLFPDSTIHYTTDGSIPTTSTPNTFTGAGTITLNASATVRALVSNWRFAQPSRVVSASFLVQPSIAVDCGQTHDSALTATNAWSTLDGPGFYSTRFNFLGTSGQLVDITATSTAFDTFMYLFDANTNLVAFNDDFAPPSTDSRLLGRLPADAAYFVEVTSYFSEETGAFTLGLACPTSPEIGLFRNVGGGLENLPNHSVMDPLVVRVGGPPFARTLILSNSGTASLIVTQLAIAPTNFTVTPASLATPLEPQQFINLVLRLSTNVVGDFPGRLEIFSNDGPMEDGVENPFVFHLQGRVDPAQAPPAVSILFPTNGAIVPYALVDIEIVAAAADAQGIQRVEFLTNGVLLGTALTPPYRILWPAVRAGQYTLTARAFDTTGQNSLSAPVVVTVGMPVVSLEQSSLCVGVNGLYDDYLVATVTNASGMPAAGVPVTFTVTGANPQTVVRPTDGSGRATWSYFGANQGYDTIVASALVDGVNITSAATNLSWAGFADCAPWPGALTTDDGPSIGCGCSTFARYADYYYFPANQGETFTFRLRSFDFEPAFFLIDLGDNCRVVATNFVLNSSNALLTFTFPASGDYLLEVTSVGLFEIGDYTAEVECAAPSVAPDLAVYVDGVLTPNESTLDYGSQTVGSPLDKTLILSNAGNATLYLTNINSTGDYTPAPAVLPGVLSPGGTHSLVLRFNASSPGLRTNQFLLNTSDPDEQPFRLTLVAVANPPGAPPTVTLTMPANGSVFIPPAVISLTADASASDGATVTNVDFIVTTPVGTFLIARDAGGPFAAVWNTSVPGAYQLAAAAYDSLGRLALSVPVMVEVRPAVFNRPPVAVRDYPRVLANSANNLLSVLENDSDPDSDPLTIIGVSTNGTGGTALIVNNNTAIRYTPPRGVRGDPADGFSYQISDGKGGFASASVAITIEASDVPAIVILEDLPPANGDFVYAGDIVSIEALVSPWQNVTNVVFFLGDLRIGETNINSGGLYTLQWTAFTEYCECGLMAAAYDRFGQVGVSQTVPIDVRRRPGTAPPEARMDNLAPVAREENNFDFLTTPVIRQGLFTLAGAAYHRTSGVPVSYAVRLLSTEGEVLRDFTPYPAPGGFHAGPVGSSGSSGTLAECDFTTIENGVYDLQLLVRGGGDLTNVTVRFVLESDLKLGPFGFTEQDLIIPVNGLPLAVLRTYNSLNPRQGDFGYSWTYSLVDLQVALDEERTDGIEPLDGEGPGPGGTFSLRTGGGRNVTLTLPDGRRTTFWFDFQPVSGSFGLSLEPIWHATPGVNARLEVLGRHQFEPLLGLWQGNANSAYEWYEFPGWTLTTEDGTQFIIERDKTGDFEVLAEDNPQLDLEGTTAGEFNAVTYGPPHLTRIVQRSGDEIRIQRERTDADRRRRFNIDHIDAAGRTNRSVVFERDGLGRIVAISDPLGQNASGQPAGPAAVRYEYDASGNLAAVLRLVDRAANGGAGAYLTNRYYYENSRFPHYLTRLEDARGIAVARNLYDDTGKLIGVIDASGRTNRFEHDLAGRREVIYDRLGQPTEHFYDERGNVTRTVNALGEVTERAYDANNYLVQEVNARRETNSYAYDDLGNRSSMTNALGHVSLYHFSGSSRLLTAIDPLGRGVTNSYDARDNLAETMDALGNATRLLHDARSLMVSQEDALGQVTTNQYDAIGRLTEMVHFDATRAVILRSNTFAYDANGNRTNETLVRSLPSGSQTEITTSVYDALNRLVLAIDPLGQTNRTVFDPAGRVERVFDKLGRETRYRYDERGLLTNVTHPDLTFESYAYDAEGRRTNMTDRLGRPTAYRYDAVGRLIQTRHPDGAEHRTVFDEAGRVAYTVDARGVTNAFGYDAAGRRVAVTNALGTPEQQIMRYDYDEAGNLRIMADATGRFVEYEYDALHRRVRSLYLPSAPGQSRPVMATAYDGLGRRVFETNEADVVTAFAYDALGRLTAVTNALGAAEQTITRYEYDTAGNLTREIRPALRITRFEHDALGRRLKRTLPLSQVETFGYDAVGNLLAHTQFNNVVITNRYDAMNRLLSRHHAADGTAFESYAYDAAGQLTNRADASGVHTWRYDLRGRVTTNTTPAGALHYAYDANGNLTNLASATPGGARSAYGYDALSRLTNVTDRALPAPNQTAYDYDGAGNLTRLEHPNGTAHAWRYDARHRLTNLVVRSLFAAGLVLGQFDYALASTGHRTNLVETLHSPPSTLNRSYAWRYDALYRLTNEVINAGGPAATLAYRYDALGNRTNRASTLPGVASTNNFYDRNDRLDNDAVSSNANPWFDAHGNTRTNGTDRFLYDWANRLTNAVLGGRTVSIAYDAAGHRVRKTVQAGAGAPVTTHYLVDARSVSGYAQVLEEKASNGGPTNLARVYSYGLDLISQRTLPTILDLQPSTFYFGVDGLGSTRLLTDAGGAVVNVFAYDAWGTLILSNGPAQTAYLHAGEQWDADLGLYYQRARYRSADAGRFWTMDSFEGNSQDPLSLHKSLYAHADPVNGTDPSGHENLPSLNAAAGIILGLSAWMFSPDIANAPGPDDPTYSSHGNVDMVVNIFGGHIVGKVVGFGVGALKIGYSKLVNFIVNRKGPVATVKPAVSGELSPSVASSFEGGLFTKTTAKTDMIVYRAEGGGSGNFGKFFGTEKPVNAVDAEIMSNVAKWGNELTRLVTYRIPKGTIVFEGKVAGGSGQQIFIPNPRASGVTIIGSEPLPLNFVSPSQLPPGSLLE